MEETGIVAAHRPLILAIEPPIGPDGTRQDEPFYCFIDGEPLPVFIVRPGHEEEDSDTLLASLRVSHSKANRLYELFVTREIIQNDAPSGNESGESVRVKWE